MALIEIHEKPTAGVTIRLHEQDNVVVARTDIGIGTRLGPDGLTCKSQVTAGFKIAAHGIAKGDPIRKYNVVIGFASADIPAGALVHSHNMEFREFDR
ncbi:MAG: UxaA family hydrolase, partial [Hyphomicrobiales bacterium]|nr:UxaA family hydrolase [Hyphomicrobiales bacterium]